MFYCIHSKTSFNQFRLVFLQFFPVLIHGSCILKISGIGDELGEIAVMDKQILLILAMDGYAV